MIQDIAPKKFHIEYKNIQPTWDDTIFVFHGSSKPEDRALVKQENGHRIIPTLRELQAAGYAQDSEQLQFLFAIDDKNYFLLNNGGTENVELPGYETITIREFWNCAPELVDEVAFAAQTAYHLFFWYRDNTCCGRCGARMKNWDKERAVRCPSCGNLVFPKLMPAVIIGLKHGDHLLISRYAGRAYKGIALLAGFCEVGETMEQTVAREIKEEVGLECKNITYFGSQPWGVDSNLLAGFFADLDGEPDITLDREELAKATWINRAEIPVQENCSSLTMTMIEAFRQGKIK